MNVFEGKGALEIVLRTLNDVDSRLVGHGMRTALIMEALANADGNVGTEMRDRVLAGLLHDIGAYKTEDISRMVEFETGSMWNHSIYGSLFIGTLSSFGRCADALFYHHLEYRRYGAFGLDAATAEISGLICAADRLDVLLHSGVEYSDALAHMRVCSGKLFDPRWVEVMEKALGGGALELIYGGGALDAFRALFERAGFTDAASRDILHMLAYAIDFRSEFMVLHTIMTVTVTNEICAIMGIDEAERDALYYSALLHDIGKVSTPVSILEKPGRLTDDEMTVMRRHVDITREILTGCVPGSVLRCACSHHERLDSSGYPQGLKGDEISLGERIVAVADVMSALVRKRSYKDAFGKEKTMGILRDLMDGGKLCPRVTGAVLDNYDEIIAHAENYGHSMEEKYNAIKQRYAVLQKYVDDIEASIPASA